MPLWVPAWAATTSTFRIPIELGLNMPPLSSPSDAIEVTGLELVWASFLSGRPRHLSPGALSQSGQFFRQWRVSASLGSLAPTSDVFPRLEITSANADLDPSEKTFISYLLGGTFAKVYSGVELDIPWLAHLSLAKRTHVILTAVGRGRHSPDYLGVNTSGDFVLAEAKGRSVLNQGLKDSLNRKDQCGAIASVNGVSPVSGYGFASILGGTPITMYATDPPVQTISGSPTDWIKEYYQFAASMAESVLNDRSPTSTQWVPLRLLVPDEVQQWLLSGDGIRAWPSLASEIYRKYSGERVQPDLCVLLDG